MPIAAYLSNLGEAKLREKEQTLVDVNALPNVDQRVETFVDEHICIVSCSHSPRVKMSISDEHVVAVEGDIINISSLAEIPARFAESGEKFANSLNGNFNLLIYERPTHSLTIINCKASRYNLYHHRLPKGYLFASNLRSIIRCMDDPPKLNLSSVLKMLSLGYIFGNDTLVESITRFPQAVIASVAKDNVNISQYWYPEYGNFYKCGIREIVEDFNHRLVEATKARFEYFGDLKIFLSGGLDSRLIAGAADVAGIKAETITYGIPGSRDLKYGKQAAEALGFPNYQYVSPGGVYKYSRYLSLLAWLTEGSSLIHPLTSTKLHPFYIERGVHAYSHGSTLPVLSSYLFYPFAFLPTSEQTKIERAFEHCTRTGSSNDRLLDIDFYREQSAKMHDEFRDSFAKIKGGHFADRYISWFFANREARATYNSSSVNGYYFNDVHFFLDNDLMDFYFRVPMKYRFEQLWQRKACVTLNPKLKDVPYTATGTKVYPYLSAAMLERVNDKWFNGAKKAKHKDSPRDVREDPELKDYLWSKATDPATLSGILQSGPLCQMIEDHYLGKRNYTGKLLCVAALARFEELFIKEKCESFPEDAAEILREIPYQNLN